eukprot:2660599-Pyramimonas_sp.AAC.2
MGCGASSQKVDTGGQPQLTKAASFTASPAPSSPYGSCHVSRVTCLRHMFLRSSKTANPDGYPKLGEQL